MAAWIPMLWGFERLHVAHHGGLRLERSAPAATLPAHGTDGSKRRGQPTYMDSKQRGIGLRMLQRGGMGWRGVRACLPTKPGSRYGETGGRRDRAARLRAAVDDVDGDPRAVAAAGSPARVVAVERSEGGGALSGRKARQGSPELLACGSGPQWSEGHGVSEWGRGRWSLAGPDQNWAFP
jgi:hypothetical protein